MTTKEGYERALRNGTLSYSSFNSIKNFLDDKIKIGDLPEGLVKPGKEGISGHLTKLPLLLAKGNKSWRGLVLGFPGSKEELSTYSVGTPYLRKILYPTLKLHERLNKLEGNKQPCLYILGDSFSDVFLRKFRLLRALIPNVVIITKGLIKCERTASEDIVEPKNKVTERWIQGYLCEKMRNPGGLRIQLQGDPISTGLLGYELPTSEGTLYPERLDILGYDKKDHSLIAFEIKGPDCGRTELENLFLQGMEHRNWLEENKRAIKLVFDGPNGTKINTRKRVRLILGFCGKKVPHLFLKLREQALREDPYLKIDFCRFITPPNTKGKLTIARS